MNNLSEDAKEKHVKRIIEVDSARGMAILLVIVGHTISDIDINAINTYVTAFTIVFTEPISIPVVSV